MLFASVDRTPVFSRDSREKFTLSVVARLRKVVDYFFYFVVVHGYYYRDKRGEVKS